MKKFAIIFCAVLFGTSVQAQEGINLGFNFGLPLADASDRTSFTVGLDANYLWSVTESFDAGVATGFTNTFGKNYQLGPIRVEGEDIQFIPLAAAGRYHFSEQFRAGIDLGYAIGINDGNNGGFYYRPMIGFGVTDAVELNLSYTGVALSDFNFATITMGLMFNF